jgi:tetratricopeptide (TPR) repeat protein
MKKLHILGIVLLLVFSLCVNLPARAAGPQPADPEEEQLIQIQQLIQSGRLDEARGQVEETLKTHSDDVRLYNFLGVIYAQEKDYTEAEANFRRAIQIAPRFSGAYINLGRLYQENAAADPRAEEKALRLYEELVKLEPDNVEGIFQAAYLSNRLGAFAKSQRYLDRLPAEAQKKTQALALRCANYVALNQLPQAGLAAQQLLAHDDLTKADIAPVLTVLAGHHADDFEMKFLEGIAARDLASVDALKELARLYEAKGRYKDARGMLERASQIEPPSAQILFWMARVTYRSGDLEGALGYLGHARDLEPDNAAVHFFFGMVCVELNLPQDAAKSLEQAVRLDPRNAYYNYALGAVLVQAKNPDEAIRYFQQFRVLRPGDARGTLAVAIAYFYSDRYDLARHELQSIADHSETRTAVQLFLGRMAMRDGNLDEALDHFQRSIQADPSVIEPYTDLGMVYIDRKEYPLAEKTLTHAIQMSPDDYLSNERLLILFQRTKDPRAAAQAIRVEQLRKTGEERERLLLRAVEVRPY